MRALVLVLDEVPLQVRGDIHGIHGYRFTCFFYFWQRATCPFPDPQQVVRRSQTFVDRGRMIPRLGRMISR